jgi:tetratricopeptide (TPR) repeat protein
MAACCFWLTWDWGLAESVTHSIEINPNYALAHFYLAHTFSNLLQHDRAESSMARARALDPFSVHLCAIHGQMLFQAGQFDAAVAEARKALAINSRSWLGHHILGKTKLQIGELEEALTSLQRAFEFSGGNTEPLSLKAFALSRLGREKEAREIVALMEEIATTAYVLPYNLAMAYHGLGDRNQTVRYLELAAQQRDVRLIFLPVDPKWRDLNQDPKVRKLWPNPQRNLPH